MITGEAMNALDWSVNKSLQHEAPLIIDLYYELIINTLGRLDEKQKAVFCIAATDLLRDAVPHDHPARKRSSGAGIKIAASHLPIVGLIGS